MARCCYIRVECLGRVRNAFAPFLLLLSTESFTHSPSICWIKFPLSIDIDATLFLSTSRLQRYLLSTMADPFTVQSGASPGVLGLLACCVVELAQTWGTNERPRHTAIEMVRCSPLHAIGNARTRDRVRFCVEKHFRTQQN